LLDTDDGDTVRRGGCAVALTNVWFQTLGDGLVRADQVTEIDAHQTPALTGKPSHWLLDVVTTGQVGSGSRGDWWINPLHRTLIQTSHHPGDAPAVLARMLAQLDAINAAGIITTIREIPGDSADKVDVVKFHFAPFAAPAPEHDTSAEYL
jgi:hypothetical protein